jgi:glycosyltransferase involved in cell wall biosynthesis
VIAHEHFICVSSIDWDSKWQGHQEISAALAESGNDVLFVENTGVRAPALRDAKRLYRRVRNWSRGYGLRTERKRLQVHSPLLLPFPYSRVARRLNGQRMRRLCTTWAQSVHCSRPILLTFLPTPLVMDLRRAIRPELTIYYCADDFASSSVAAGRIRSSETTLLGEADLVFVTSERLRVRAAQFRDEVHLLPAGVRFSDFERVRTTNVARPVELEKFSRPIVGYIGGLTLKTDEELLTRVARHLSDVEFVVIGPVLKTFGALQACPNVHVLGHRPHAEVPLYLKHFGAGIIPYRVTEYTSHIYPAKLNEYLAMGLPVVSTSLPEVQRFNEANGNVVAIADSADGFAAAIRRALGESASAAISRRIAVAHGNRWEPKIATMTGLVERMLRERRDSALSAVKQPFRPFSEQHPEHVPA